MKKTMLLFVTALSASFAIAQSQRLVFVEEFTQASCGPCAAQNPAFNALLSANTNKVVSLKYQTSWPGVDPMNAQNPTEVANRVTYYNVTGVPNAIMDGNVVNGAPSAITQANINTEYAVPSPFSIQLNFWFNTAQDSVFINCEVTCTQNTTLTTGKLRIAMMEKLIHFTSPPGTNGETDFYNVMRKMYPNANGTALQGSWSVGQKKTVSFKAKIPTYIYSKPQIAFVAWVQDDANKNTKQAAFAPTVSAPLQQAPVVDFSADVVTSCDGIVKFKDLSALFPGQWLWNFGDNTTSTLQNPTHTYLNSGTYTVTLTATNSNGSSQYTRTSYVNVQLTGTPPTGVGDNICTSGTANLSATAANNGTLVWFNAQNNQVGTGNTYSQFCNGTTNFYVREMIPNGITSVGPTSNSIGAGAYFTANNTHGLYFDASSSCVLQSFDVYANSAGNRTIDVIDENGVTIQSAVRNIPAGQSTVTVNFQIPAGVGYLIKISSTLVDLYRNSAGATFPYSSSVITITGNTAAGNPTYYYYFYNWKVVKNPCATPATLVIAQDSCFTAINQYPESYFDMNVYPNPNNGLFTASFNTSKEDNYTVKITNTLGEVVYQEVLNNFSGNYNKQIDLSSFAKGVYMLTVSNSANQTVKKIIAQ